MLPKRLVLTVLLAVAGWRTRQEESTHRQSGGGSSSESEARAGALPDEMTLICDSLVAWIRESARNGAVSDSPWRNALVERFEGAQQRRVEELRRSARSIRSLSPDQQDPALARMRETVSAIVRDQRRKERLLMAEFIDEGGSE